MPFSSTNTACPFIPTKIPLCLLAQYFLCKDPAFSLCAEEEMDYSHHYLTLGMILGLLFPTSQEWKLASELKYYLQNLIIYWVGPVLDEGKSVRRKEGQSVTDCPQSPFSCRGRERRSGVNKRSWAWEQAVVGTKMVLVCMCFSSFYYFFFNKLN